ncbi:MFS transporter [Embleya sp. NPDC056575]|uniref:MFS transporter n=1 Tax=unclassified Embleya TaxID=2699296 RepID=UPI00368A8F5D
MTKERAMPQASSSAATLAALRHSRGFRTYFLAQFGSNIGTWTQITGLSWLMLDMTGSASKLGAVLAMETLPVLVLGPFAGSIVDRYDVRRLTVATQSALASIVVALAVLQLLERLDYGTTIVLSFLFGAVLSVDNPARQSLLPELVDTEDLGNAIAMNVLSTNGSSLIGPALGGLVVGWCGSAWCFVLNGATFLAVALALSALRTRDRGRRTGDQNAPKTAKGTIANAFRHVTRTPAMRDALLMMACVGALTYEFPVTLPLLAREGFDAGPVLYGLFFAAAGIGATLGGLHLAGRRNHDGAAAATAGVTLGAFVLSAAWTPQPVAVIGLFILVGAASIRFMALTNAAVLENAPAEFRGRIMAFWNICFQGSTLIGAPAVGCVAATFGARWALALGGTAALGAGLLGLSSHRREHPPTRRLRAHRTPG